MIKSTWMRWVVCVFAVMALLALLGGCTKKESGEATTETTEEMAETDHTGHAHGEAPAMAGTYAATMANGTASLMLNPDMSASFSMQPMENAPAMVENGTWAAGTMGNTVDVTFSRMVEDSTMSVTLNFEAHGDSLALTNGESVGMTGLVLVKQ